MGYKLSLTPEMMTAAEQLREQGMIIDDICEKLGIATASFRRLRKKTGFYLMPLKTTSRFLPGDPGCEEKNKQTNAVLTADQLAIVKQMRSEGCKIKQIAFALGVTTTQFYYMRRNSAPELLFAKHKYLKTQNRTRKNKKQGQ